MKCAEALNTTNRETGTMRQMKERTSYANRLKGYYLYLITQQREGRLDEGVLFDAERFLKNLRVLTPYIATKPAVVWH